MVSGVNKVCPMKELKVEVGVKTVLLNASKVGSSKSFKAHGADWKCALLFSIESSRGKGAIAMLLSGSERWICVSTHDERYRKWPCKGCSKGTVTFLEVDCLGSGLGAFLERRDLWTGKFGGVWGPMSAGPRY